MEQLSWTFPVRVADLPESGKEFHLIPDEGIREALARIAGVIAVPTLSARFHVEADGRGGAKVTGDLQGAVTQTCVLTLESFDNAISERIDLRFAPAESISPSAAATDLGEGDPPDPLVGEEIDLAKVVAEFLSLAIDPYPRKPGAKFVPPPGIESAMDEAVSPFAALEKLKGGRVDKNE